MGLIAIARVDHPLTTAFVAADLLGSLCFGDKASA
jgi:hypothetical protein